MKTLAVLPRRGLLTLFVLISAFGFASSCCCPCCCPCTCCPCCCCCPCVCCQPCCCCNECGNRCCNNQQQNACPPGLQLNGTTAAPTTGRRKRDQSTTLVQLEAAKRQRIQNLPICTPALCAEVYNPRSSAVQCGNPTRLSPVFASARTRQSMVQHSGRPHRSVVDFGLKPLHYSPRAKVVVHSTRIPRAEQSTLLNSGKSQIPPVGSYGRRVAQSSPKPSRNLLTVKETFPNHWSRRYQHHPAYRNRDQGK